MALNVRKYLLNSLFRVCQYADQNIFYSTTGCFTMSAEETALAKMAKNLPPKLSDDKHKGQVLKQG